MSYRRVPFAIDEFYHCYTRGIDKRVTFQDKYDYERFIEALYVCNDESTFKREHFESFSHTALLQLERGKPLVSIIAYCLMPNHYHLVLREVSENGIAQFMQKVGTMYTMYFNAKYQRIGGLFVGPFRSKHIDDDIYLKKVIPYIHLNPIELVESKWKEGAPVGGKKLHHFLRSYTYSSFIDYEHVGRVEKNLLDFGTVQNIHDTLPTFSEIFHEASEYYSNLKW